MSTEIWCTFRAKDLKNPSEFVRFTPNKEIIKSWMVHFIERDVPFRVLRKKRKDFGWLYCLEKQMIEIETEDIDEHYIARALSESLGSSA